MSRHFDLRLCHLVYSERRIFFKRILFGLKYEIDVYVIHAQKLTFTERITTPSQHTQQTC